MNSTKDDYMTRPSPTIEPPVLYGTSLDAPLAGLLQVQPKPSLSHVPLTNPQAYYRSKVMSATTGVNPLITAAAALLALFSELRALPLIQDSHTLYEELVHEIKAFESLTQTQGYRSETILIARYILCSALDEMITASAWGEQGHWHKHKLLNTFHNEDWGGERFFLILDRLSADPALHIDVLELIYICLNLGYMGKYQMIENGKIQLEEIMEKLYQRIRWQRGNIKKELAISEEPVTTSKSLDTTAPQQIPPWLLTLLTATLLLTTYTIFNFFLGNNVAPIYQQLNTILQ